MSDQETAHEATVFWAVRPEMPSRMTRALRRMKILSRYSEPLPNEHIPISQIPSVEDERLRVALQEQAQDSDDTKYVVIPVAFPDGRFSHAWHVRKGSMFGSRQANENN